MEKSGDDIDPVVLAGLIETGVMMLREGKITAQELLTNYVSVSELTENQLNKGGRPERSEQIYSRINTALLKAGITNCNEIEGAFQSKLITDSTNTRTLSFLSELIVTSGCENTDFFGSVNEKLFLIEPTSDRAYSLAWYYIRKENFETAMHYLKEAIEIESDTQKQSHYYYQMALIYNTKMNLQQEAVSSATKALNLRPDWGEPYFVIASAYILASKDCFDGAFERSTVYWVAADKCNKAKTVDKSVENKANGLIADYIRFFPNTEEIFFRAFQEGSEYSVGCWINEKTTVRARK
jgi:tetratricopeptide (TPR) repeat protein